MLYSIDRYLQLTSALIVQEKYALFLINFVSLSVNRIDLLPLEGLSVLLSHVNSAESDVIIAYQVILSMFTE